VIFQGRNLDTGANIRVLFDDVPCHVEGLVVTGIFHINIIINVYTDDDNHYHSYNHRLRIRIQ